MLRYNLLKDAISIKNVVSCRYDSLLGYEVTFITNGDVNGWDIYSNIGLYGAWGTILFGTSLDNSCYISLTNGFIPLQSEQYRYVSIVMKLTLPENSVRVPTTGKLMWQTTNDDSWTENKSKFFKLNLSDNWFTYILNMGESQYWYGDVKNLRIYPFIDGCDDIQFAIKTITIKSVDTFRCLNTQCSYFSNYSHWCTGIGKYASITSGIAKLQYTTIFDETDLLLINIDGYGDEHVHIGTYIELTGSDMAKIIGDKLSRFNIGQYTYAEVNYDPILNKLTIRSGSTSDNQTIYVSGPAAIALGFNDEDGNDVSVHTYGELGASGFDFYASHRLTGYEFKALIDADVQEVAYYHNPTQYTTEAGRSDFMDSMSATYKPRTINVDYYEKLVGNNKLLIDGSHPVTDSGRLSIVYVNGQCSTDVSKVVLLRPYKNSTVKIIESKNFTKVVKDAIYTSNHVTYKINVDWLVNKGDLIGFYNFDILCPFSMVQQVANAVYFEVYGLPEGKFKIEKSNAQGVVGLSYYARSDRLQRNIAIDIDIGRRLNLDTLSVYGKEYLTKFEYNLAACLDTGWQVNLYNDTHWHIADYLLGYIPSRHVEHRNKVYGIDCLSDCITTEDGGQSGDVGGGSYMGGPVTYDGTRYISNSNPDVNSGFVTAGEHTYCYVNGDSEWLNGRQGYAEFYPPWRGQPPTDYEFDPIGYYLFLPYKKSRKIHKFIAYFKDSDNFKHLSMSYYTGINGVVGNSNETHFEYINNIKSVNIDGRIFYPDMQDGNSSSEKYITVLLANPWPWGKPIIVNKACINSDIYQTVVNHRMNVMQYEFEPVSAYGFKFFTDWHESTKLYELELFSSMVMGASLLDNVGLQTSVYGDDWFDSVFLLDENEDNKIYTEIIGSPRYFRLELTSQDLFELFEVSAEITVEKIKSVLCENTLLIGKDDEQGSVKQIEIENSYDVILDIFIDLPDTLFAKNELLSWIKFSDLEHSVNAELGPGAIIYKNADRDIYLEHNQIANNTPAYYLKNLIDNKKSYTFENNYGWKEYKTLYANQDVGYSNNPNSKVYTLKFSPVSCKYYKIGVFNSNTYTLQNIKVFNENKIELKINKLYIQVGIDEKSSKYVTTFNEVGQINDAIIIEERFQNDSFLTTWSLYANDNNTLIRINNALCPYLSSFGVSYIEKVIPQGILSFSLEVVFKFDLPNQLQYRIELLDVNNNLLFVLEMVSITASSFELHLYGTFDDDQATLLSNYGITVPMRFNWSVISKEDTKNFKFKIEKIGNTFSSISLTTEDDITVFYNSVNSMGFCDKIYKCKISYSNLSFSDYYNKTDRVSTIYFKLLAKAVFSNREFIGFSFNSSESISSIEIIQDNPYFKDLALYISYTDNNDYICYSRDFSTTNNLCIANTKTYMALDLPIYHNMHPLNMFDGSNDYFRFRPCTTWVRYDFGHDNAHIINYIYYKESSSTVYTGSEYIDIYGSNSDNLNFDANSYVNIFLTRLYIDHSVSSLTKEGFFSNTSKFRFIILHFNYVVSDLRIIDVVEVKFSRVYSENIDLLNISSYNYFKYLVIDLGQVHVLDFIRHYGDKDYLLPLFNVSYIDFSSSNTYNVLEVNWSENKPSLLLSFDDYLDKSFIGHVVTVSNTGVRLLYTNSAVIPAGHIEFSAGGFITIPVHSCFNLYNNNFTIDFRLYRHKIGKENIAGVMSKSFINSSFMFSTEINNFMVVTVYSGNEELLLRSTTPILTDYWSHIALTRYYNNLYLFVDGKCQCTIYIGETTFINNAFSSFSIGKVNNIQFNGCIDEFRFINGYAVWTEDFLVKYEKYAVDNVGNKSAVRWIKIPFLCGDGVLRNTHYIGIYPDIMFSHTMDGKYNCEWGSLNCMLSDYNTTNINIAPYANIIDFDRFSSKFDQFNLMYWEHVEYETSDIIIIQADFKNMFPSEFWIEYINTFNNSSFIHDNNKLVISLLNSSSGYSRLLSDVVNVDCECEMDFTHEINIAGFNSIKTSLSIYNNTKIDKITLSREITNSSCWVHVYENEVARNSANFSGLSIQDITKFKIIRRDINIDCWYYNKRTKVWYKIYTFLAFTFSHKDAYFSFDIVKSNTYPKDIIIVEYFKITMLNEILVPIKWVVVENTEDELLNIGNYLICSQRSIFIDEGPTLKLPLLSAGKKIKSFEYYYFDTGTGGGFSILDASGVEILGVASFAPEWGIKSLVGWTIVNYSPKSGINSWYRVMVEFNWDEYKAIVFWHDITKNETLSYTMDLICKTNVSTFKLRSIQGNTWGYNFVGMKYSQITVIYQDSFMSNWFPINCLSGDSSKVGFENCWGFPASNKLPTLCLDLGQEYNIDNFILYHNVDIENTSWLNTSYSIYGSTTISGVFTELLTVVNNTEYVAQHFLEDSVISRYIKLEIKTYKKPTQPIKYKRENIDGTFDYVYIDGGFLREFEINLGSQKLSNWVLNSEDMPIVCMDLKDRFNISGHCYLPNNPSERYYIKYKTGLLRRVGLWSDLGELENDDFVQYSSIMTDDPKKVAFSDTFNSTVVFSFEEEIMDYALTGGPYLINTSVFISEGYYEIKWSAYNSYAEGCIELSLNGPVNVQVCSVGVSEAWSFQQHTFSLSKSGYYTLMVKALDYDFISVWGVTDIAIKTNQTLSRWVAIRRNTATNFAYKTTNLNYVLKGIDILKILKIYATGLLRPTEYYWWWSCLGCELSNDSVNVIMGKRSLKISYTSFDSASFIYFLPGDSFGKDINYSIKDALVFWLYIEDVSKLDTNFGGVAFGNFNKFSPDGAPISLKSIGNKAIIGWDFKNITLVSGWNRIFLRLDKFDKIYPEVSATHTDLTKSKRRSMELSSDLDFRQFVTSSFGIVFKGKGQPFYMLVDGLRIERNSFYDDVTFNMKGLCLTWNEYAEIPLSGIDLRKGTIEMWLKLYTNTAGVDVYGTFKSRTIFTITTNMNEILTLSLRSGKWFEIGYNNLKSEYRCFYLDSVIYDVSPVYFDIDDVFHIALSWSNNGVSMDDNSTLKLYINNKLVVSSKDTWVVNSGNTAVLRLGGGNTYLANNDDTEGSAIFSNVKYYNYCKTTFDLSNHLYDEVNKKLPNDFIQISQNNVDYYGSRSSGLPLTYKSIKPEEKVVLFLKTSKIDAHCMDSLTGFIHVDWQLPV